MKNLGMMPIIIFSFAVISLSPFLGMMNIPFCEIFGGSESALSKVLFELRIPRVLLAWLTGSTLALCGLIFQALFRNSLASPDMLGVSAGAAFGAVLYIKLGVVFSLFGVMSGLSLSAFAGAMAATLAIYAAGRIKRETLSESSLLLAGVAMSFLFGSLNMIIQYSSGYVDTFRMMRWSMGGIQIVGFYPVIASLPAFVLVFAVAFTAGPELDLLICGEDIASGRGVSVARLRKILFFSVSAAIGLSVAICGPIGFIGLMVPHICRKISGGGHRRLAVASVFFGGGFLVLCDTAARIILAPAELPVGVLTSCIGSVFFLSLLIKGKR